MFVCPLSILNIGGGGGEVVRDFVHRPSGDVQEVCDVSEAKLIRMIMVKSALFHGIVPQAVASCHGNLG